MVLVDSRKLWSRLDIFFRQRRVLQESPTSIGRQKVKFGSFSVLQKSVPSTTRPQMHSRASHKPTPRFPHNQSTLQVEKPSNTSYRPISASAHCASSGITKCTLYRKVWQNFECVIGEVLCAMCVFCDVVMGWAQPERCEKSDAM